MGVVGPIGAGKSSLLDAIAFALYGKTPTEQKETRSLIHQLAHQCHVELVFEVDGQVWRAQRGIRRRGQAGHKLERLAADEPGAEVLEDVQQEKKVRERVERLLGMDFTAFCRSVLLAQNQFDEFLHARPTERNHVLKGVFGLERFDAALQVAKQRVAVADAELSGLAAERDRIERARGELDEGRERAKAATARHEALREARERIDTLGKERDAAGARAAEAEARVDRLRSIASDLPTPDTLEVVTRDADMASDAVKRAAEALDVAEHAQTQAETERDAVIERLGDRTAVREFAELVAKHGAEVDRATELQERTEAAKTRETEAGARAEDAVALVESAGAARGAAEAGLAEAIEATSAAEAAFHEVQHANMAVTLRRELQSGQTCPVCDRPIETVPKPGRAPGLSAAERGVERASSQEEKARTAVKRAEAEVAKATADADAAAREAGRRTKERAEAQAAQSKAEASVTALKSELVDRLGEGDPNALLAARDQELEAAGEAVEAANASVRARREELDAARAGQQRAGRAIADVASSLTSAWGRLDERRPVTAEPEAVRAAFVEIGERLVGDETEASAARETAEAASTEATTQRAAELARLGLEPDIDFAQTLADAQAAHAAADQRLRSLEAEIDAGKNLAARVAGVEARRTLAARLRDDLQPSQFLAFVLEEERTALAEIGSLHFEELSGGAYRFSDDDAFNVVDLNGGGTTRSADSLSGGETFLASLALALALAEMVTRGGGRLDSFFLDEGFGSLDPEHLDRAMDGIGRLVAGDGGRLVVLVSHVAEMREMLEDLVVLDKDPRTGETKVISGATLG